MRNNFILWTVCLLLVLILSACGTASAPSPEEDPGQQSGEVNRSVSGMIVGKETNGNGQQLLVYPSDDPIPWEDRPIDEWINKAQEESADISWYVVEDGQYEQLEVGQHVRMTIQPEQLDPYPPIRFVIDLEVTPST
ncbi:hypothetical protein [Paenibacillus sp. 1P07SE]|uniref:hypothetical protein n=1 Tax=Paenibacillus sp. 1P07SE TaxID=3132209 RepID=UPI0039A78557